MFEKILEWLPEQEESKPNKFTLYMGSAIKKAREEAGISQEELAKKIYRRRATLSDIETGKADVDAVTLWLFSAYLKKPLSYFYPEYARETIRPEEMSELEHELLMYFIEIRGEQLRRLAIEVIKKFTKFETENFVIEQAPYVSEFLRTQKEFEKFMETRKKIKIDK